MVKPICIFISLFVLVATVWGMTSNQRLTGEINRASKKRVFRLQKTTVEKKTNMFLSFDPTATVTPTVTPTPTKGTQ